MSLMGDREKCLAAGMDEYFPKPIIAKDLLALMDKLLDVQNVEIIEHEPVAAVPVKEEVKEVNEANEVIADEAVFDFDRLKKISGDDIEFERDLIGSYIEDIEQKYKQLDDYLTVGDVESIAKLAHTIKGASYSVGAQRVGDEAFGIEISAKSNDVSSITERLPQFKKTLDETINVLSEILEPQK